jgi:hypothetical protein
MTEFTAPNIILIDHTNCYDCRFLTGGFNASCELLGPASPTIAADDINRLMYPRPDVCPLQLVKRCGDCEHYVYSGVYFNGLPEKYCHKYLFDTAPDWYCADFKVKEK